MSEKTIAQKLLIKPGYRVAFVNAPRGYKTLLGALPKNVTVTPKPTGAFDLIQVFVANQNELETQLAKLKSFLHPKIILWITYLKGTAKIKTDVNRDTIYAYAKSFGLQGVALISIDDDWSALRLKMVS